MTDLDNTQIITADESLLENSSTNDTEASLKIVSGADSNTYQIGKETIIGRTNPSDVVISASSLSKQHAKITYNNGQYFITDLGSSNKTFHNKIQLQPNVCYALHNGDEIKLGDIICSFQQQKQIQTDDNTLSEPTYQTYIPPMNTLVEEDSPWPSDDDMPPPVITETNVDVIPSTQTITDSYDDQEPTQPMKIWNGNSNNTNRLNRTSIKNSDDVTPKQNGLNESSTSNKSSSFLSSTSSASHDDNDDESLVIGGTTLPATVPLVIESTQLNDDDQLEIVSSSQTKKIIEEDNNKIAIEITTTTPIEIENTQAYTLEPTGEIISSNNEMAETQAYELESEQIITEMIETKREEVHQVVINGNTIIEKNMTRTTTTVTENDNLPTETLAYDLQSTTEEITTTTTKTIVENNNLPMETLAYDLQPTAEEIVMKTTMAENNNLPTETLAYDLQPTTEEITTTTTTTTKTTIVENNNLPMETLAYDLEPTTEEIATKTTIVENNNIPTETLAYDLQPTNEEITTTTTTTTTTTIVENNNLPMETLAYDLQPTNEHINLDTNVPAECPDTQAYSLDEEIDDLSPRPASEKLEVVPVSKLAEQLKEVENIADDTTPKQQVEIIINRDVVKEATEDEPMDTNQTELPPTTVNDEPETIVVNEQQENVNKTEDETVPITNTDAISVDETEKTNGEIESTNMEQETTPDMNKSFTATPIEPEQKIDEPKLPSAPEEVPPSTLDTTENQQEEPEGAVEEEEEEETEESAPVSGRGQRGVPRRAARRARGRRGGAARARVVSTRIHGGRRNAVVPSTLDNEDNNATLEETVNTEPEESPSKSTITSEIEQKTNDTQPIISTSATPADQTSLPSQTNSGSNIRVSARIKARASSGRNRQFPYTDDYVDLDDLEKQSKTSNTPPVPPPPTTTSRRSTRGGRSSSTPQKRISLRQQPIDASESPDEKTKNQKDATDIYEQMDTGGENEEPILSTKTLGRKRKSTTPVASTTTKRTRSTTPQTAPPTNTRRKPTLNTDEITSSSDTITPKRGRKPTKLTTPTEQTPEKQISTNDRPVRIALSSHLNFDQNHLDTLRKFGFEIMDESCQVDALVVDRIRRTKKFFMCLARGAHILSPTWIEAMIKENHYIPYDKYYLEDTNAETRYGFHLRDSVQLAKKHPIFENYKIFCTKDTSPPYDDLKDIIEAAGGKFIEKINTNKPGKDLICIVAQIHKNEYEDLYKKGVPIVSEEFALSGISKQKLDFDSFSLFQNTATTVKTTGNK